MPGSGTCSPPGSPAKSVNTSPSSTAPGGCSVTPVAHRSPAVRGSDFVVARRLALNHHLGAAVHRWAFCSLRRSGWAREVYDGKITAGKGHHAALRALGSRWRGILSSAFAEGFLYDVNIHVRPRPRTSRLSRRLTEG